MGVKDGGPAFPRDSTIHGTEGMTLRDWFAGQALTGLLSGYDNPIDSDAFAGQAYDLADAMIKERDG